MKKEKTIKVNETQEKILKDALKNEKANRETNIKHLKQYSNRETQISEVYEIEKLEKQLE